MSYSHPEIKSFKGLYIQQNSFTVPDGALEVADNVAITQDGVITKRRGYSLFSAATGGGTLNNLFLYQGNLLALYNTKIARADSAGVQTDLTPYTGVTVSETSPRIGRSAEANSNLYFTSDNGPLKLESYTSTVYLAGVPPALDLRGYLFDVSGPIGDGENGAVIGSTQVLWRVTFGRTDSNNNLLESSPSDILALTNAPITGQAASWNGTTVTVTTSAPHGLTTGNSVGIFDAVNSGGTSVDALNGTQVITVTGASSFTYPNAATSASGTLSYGVAKIARLEFSIPSEIKDTSYFYRVYRSSQGENADTIPDLDFKLINQTNLTSAQITAGVVSFTDTVLDLFQSQSAELYTNPNSQEGELQANARPPLCQDIAFYKNHTFYANTTNRHQLFLSLISTSGSYLSSGSNFDIKLGATTRHYVFRTGVGNNQVTATASGSTTITVTYTAHGLANGDTVYIDNVTGTVPAGNYVISSVAANTFQFTSTGNSATQLDFEGLTNTSGDYIVQLSTSGTVAVNLDATARGIVKAVNRDASSLVYARYISSPTDIPGKMYFQAKGFGGSFSIKADSPSTGQAFSPALPDSFASGTQVTSTNDALPHVVFSSKVGQPESVPIVNTLPVGSKNKAILRIVPLRDCCIVIKEDGIYRIDGDAVGNFVSTILDSTVLCQVPSSVALIDNTVMMLSNQGVVKISSSAVQIVSYRIEQVIRAILGNANLLAQTSAVAYESERVYLLTTLEPNTDVASTVYCYNTLTDSWTTWDTLFKNGIVGPSDKLFLIGTGNAIAKERKNQNKLDYTGQDYAVTVTSVASNGMSAVVSFPTSVPQPGDILVSNSVISRIKTVASLGGPSYSLTFYLTTSLAAGSATHYEKYAATIKFAPFHAGAINRAKQFSQFQVHLRDPGASIFNVTFSNEFFGSSESVDWNAYQLAGQSGWGDLPWGFFPWGLDDGINLTYTTQPAPCVRLYIPRFVQRGVFIQPLLVHDSAGERLSIQEIGYTVRGYGERVSK